jgi:hypothetical protein
MPNSTRRHQLSDFRYSLKASRQGRKGVRAMARVFDRSNREFKGRFAGRGKRALVTGATSVARPSSSRIAVAKPYHDVVPSSEKW